MSCHRRIVAPSSLGNVPSSDLNSADVSETLPVTGRKRQIGATTSDFSAPVSSDCNSSRTGGGLGVISADGITESHSHSINVNGRSSKRMAVKMSSAAAAGVAQAQLIKPKKTKIKPLSNAIA